jgi:hypothetical protein
MTEEAKEKLRKRLQEHPLRTRPLYSERFGKDGYIEIKYADVPHGNRKDNWKNKQVWVYEQHHNITVDSKKDVVVFLDGDKYNFDIDNLMLIPRRVLNVINRLYKFTNNRDDNLAIIYNAILKLQMNDLAEKYGLVYKYGNNRVIKFIANERVKEYCRKMREKKKNKK